ncbi:MAG: pantoate--beta-alanine ligase [Gammaproteobacteria bacterium]|nr:pantoate--beta-alanine ligase [Gammaproteobacteria bacterium]MDH3362928.1 pantoate--beta-alanine ligase [Gammaproteobacteria bacterium]MDH3480957.1 pantoate--beta-alanine ligase [Gammaproteobacteria bacterium]
MRVVHSKQELSERIAEWRQQDEHVALVPTMGNLHAGHIALVKLAREHAERVVVSIFVNPTQFGDGEDFDDYPRTLEVDKRRLKTTAADLIFAPDVDTVYPFGIDQATTVSVPELTENFCGASRPGHFDGVTTVVARLFALVQPDVAVFGQKDYQQQLVIRRMVEDMNLPVTIITCETIREDDGLALSSRNSYLTEEERATAPQLYEALKSVGEDLQNGRRNFSELEIAATRKLADAGFEVDYFAIRRAQNLAIPDRDCDDLVVLAAARLGAARLIDNIVVTV